MLTPAFELSQDEKFVYVCIKTPYIKIDNVEFFIEGCNFKFYVKPYFLRLNLPSKIVENGEESATYDIDKGLFTVKLPKMVPGYHFQDLDLLTKLLAPSGEHNISSPVIEVISDESLNKEKDEISNEELHEEEDEDNWEWEQDVYDEKEEHQLSLNGIKYGFANKRSGVFYCLKDNLKEIIENPNPDELSYHERRIARIAAEQEKFDPNHYLADYFDSERNQEVLNYMVNKNDVLLTEEEKTKLRELPNKEYLLDEKEGKSAYLSLVDIMFAYAYNHRTTLGENTVESAWTISTLSSTLSWFESFTNLQDVLEACCRRSLSYPLYRHWEISCKVIEDVRNIFHAGRRKILKCLLEIHALFNSCEPRYLLNELYITDYCIWIQKEKERKFESLAKKLSKATITKENVGLELKELEAAALLVYDEQHCEGSESSNEPSSSSCSNTEDEASIEDSEDDENSESIIPSEVSDSIAQSGLHNSVFGGKLCSEEKDVLDEQEGASENGRTDNVKILPSLFEEKRIKPLVEVINEEQNEADNTEASNYTETCAIESLCRDKGLVVDINETERQQTELSERVLDLSLTSNDQ